MPIYDYLCEDCGPFTNMRAMAECETPSECPSCDHPAPRAYLTAPRISGMSSDRMIAHATNEKASHEPGTLSGMKKKHGAGCGCCSGGSKKNTITSKSGAKTFPGKRPWMISH